MRYIVGREPNSLYGETLNGAFPFTPAPFPEDQSVCRPRRSEERPAAARRTEAARPQGRAATIACRPTTSASASPTCRRTACRSTKPANYNPLDYEAARAAHRHDEEREARPAQTRGHRPARQRRRPGDQLRTRAQSQDRLELRQRVRQRHVRRQLRLGRGGLRGAREDFRRSTRTTRSGCCGSSATTSACRPKCAPRCSAGACRRMSSPTAATSRTSSTCARRGG